MQWASLAPASATVMGAATAVAPLLLTAGDGPWSWRATRYTLLDGSAAGNEHRTSFSQEAVAKRRTLGSVSVSAADGLPMSAAHDGATLTFSFAQDEPLTLGLTSFGDAGVGHRVWDSAIVMALFQRSGDAPAMPLGARVLELGAGVGLPGIDIARRAMASSVTLTDARPRLVSLLDENARKSGASGASRVRAVQLDWDHLNAEVDAAVGSDTDASTDPASTRGRYDLVIGSDICYDESSVPGLKALILATAAPLTLVVGPITRPSVGLLGASLEGVDGVEIERRTLTLICSPIGGDAKAPGREAGGEAGHGDGEGRVRSGGVHQMLLIRQGGH